METSREGDSDRTCLNDMHNSTHDSMYDSMLASMHNSMHDSMYISAHDSMHDNMHNSMHNSMHDSINKRNATSRQVGKQNNESMHAGMSEYINACRVCEWQGDQAPAPLSQRALSAGVAERQGGRSLSGRGPGRPWRAPRGQSSASSRRTPPSDELKTSEPSMSQRAKKQRNTQ